MKRAIFILMFTSFFWINCKEDEKEVNLGDNFYYIPFQETTFDVTSFGGNGIYRYDDSLKNPVIFPNIEEYKFDNNFIIVKQKFDEKETQKLIENMLFVPNAYFKFNKSYIVLDENILSKIDTSKKNSIYYENFTEDLMTNTSAIQEIKKNEVNYYIIDKKKAKIWGPIKINEFNEATQKLKIDLDF